MKILLIIPARGGSKGIPRKNIRNLAGRPLIYYSIQTALHSKYNFDVYVSSDDDEILSISNSLGVKTHKREIGLACDLSTLDPVIYDSYLDISRKNRVKYDYVVTLQPTSPILKSSTLDDAIDKAISSGVDTMLSVKEESHLSWKKTNDGFVPNYKERLNRQELEVRYIETGGFVISKSDCFVSGSRFGKSLDVFSLSNGEEIDIDGYDDWSVCEYYLKRKKVLFVVIGNRVFGLGHVYNSLIVANDLTGHDVLFLVDKDSELAYKKIKSRNYPVFIQRNENIIDDILNIAPDVVINDKLDTSSYYVKELKKHGMYIVNFEDLGDGGKHADLVINAIYSSKDYQYNYYYGHNYYLLRDEFYFRKPVEKISPHVSRVLVTFGGTDSNNLTYKVISSIYEYCCINKIIIDVVSGIGYSDYAVLSEFGNINIYKNIDNISEFMVKADIIFSAMGRTVYEISSLGIPALLMSQNKRELSHTFGYGQNGFINLGEGCLVSNDDILRNFRTLSESFETRCHMNGLMKQYNLRKGRSMVIALINSVLGK